MSGFVNMVEKGQNLMEKIVPFLSASYASSNKNEHPAEALAKADGPLNKYENWIKNNDNADFNRDGIINLFDLSIIIKNMAKTGDSGVWVSTPATSSGTPNL